MMKCRKKICFVFVFLLLLSIMAGCRKTGKHDTGRFTVRLSEGWQVKESPYSPDLSGGDILKLEKKSAAPLGEGKSAYYPLMIIERHDRGYVKQDDGIHHYRTDGTVKIGKTSYEIRRADYLGFVYQYISYDKGNDTFIVLISVTLEGKFIDISFEDADIQDMILSLK